MINKKIPEYVVNDNIRLFDFLMQNLKGKSRNNIKSLLSRKLILVNGAPSSQFDFELIKGDVVSISPHPVHQTKQRMSKLEIIYEDDEFIVINKPAGLLSVASDKEKNITAYRLVSDYIKEEDKKKRIYVVHRIDKETSGVLMFVKNQKLAETFREGDNWNNLMKTREYLALVEGTFEKKEGRLVNYLKESSTNLVYVGRGKDGLLSITNYKVIEENEKYSLLDIKIETGRKNQIRVQLKHINHPIVGDDKYQSNFDPLKRLGLHAYKLSFVHPLNHKTYTFVAKEKGEFKKVFASNFVEGKQRKVIEKKNSKK